ncbi:MAG: hypothetical protein HY689_15695 [Chloroflexi bacterium]|nr:hypothetical protein [Chloroflexota bacterium]
MRKVLVALDNDEFDKLEQLAQKEERIVEQQARFIIKRALQTAAPRPAPGEEASDA